MRAGLIDRDQLFSRDQLVEVYSHVIEEAKAEATECIADVLLRRRQA